MNRMLENIVEKTKGAYQGAKRGAVIGLAALTLASCNPNSMKTEDYLIELPNGGKVLVTYQLKDRGMFGYKEITTMQDGDERLVLKQRKGIGKKNRSERLIHEVGRNKVVYTNKPINNNVVEKIRVDGETYRYDAPGVADIFGERTVFYDQAKRDLLEAKRLVKDADKKYLMQRMREGLESALQYQYQ